MRFGEGPATILSESAGDLAMIDGTLDDRWLGLWVADDGTAMRISRPTQAFVLEISDRLGAVIGRAELAALAETLAELELALCADESAIDGVGALRDAKPEDERGSLRIRAAPCRSAKVESITFTPVEHRATPHPNVTLRGRYWRVSVRAGPVESLPGREQDRSTETTDPSRVCAQCGLERAALSRWSDDSGTGWRQQYFEHRCERCGRYTLYHYDD